MRIVFTKEENARFISHLDLVRCFTRIFNRADIPVSLTQGFHKHPYMVFSPPLSLGVLSEAEIIDIRTDTPFTPEEMRQRLERAVPVDIKIADVYEDGDKLNNINSATYTISLPEKDAADIKEFLSLDKIEAEKKAKKGGTKTVNISEGLNVIGIDETADTVTVTLTLPCNDDINIGINLLWKAFTLFKPDKHFNATVIRKNFLKKDGTIFR